MALSGRDNSKDMAFSYWFKLKAIDYLKHWEWSRVKGGEDGDIKSMFTG